MISPSPYGKILFNIWMVNNATGTGVRNGGMTIKAKILCLVGAFALLAMVITGLGLNTMTDYNRVIEDYRHASDNAMRGERLNRYMMQAALDGHGIYSADSPHMAQ